jgi:hypothetical protein
MLLSNNFVNLIGSAIALPKSKRRGKNNADTESKLNLILGSKYSGSLPQGFLVSSPITNVPEFAMLTKGCWCSSVVEQRFCKPPVASSNLVTSLKVI